MTRSFDPAQLCPAAGLFRPANHAMVMPQGVLVTILDLEQGLLYFHQAVWRRDVAHAGGWCEATVWHGAGSGE